MGAHDRAAIVMPPFPGRGLPPAAGLRERIKIGDLELGEWPSGLDEEPSNRL
jgi:hypothetical protein